MASLVPQRGGTSRHAAGPGGMGATFPPECHTQAQWWPRAWPAAWLRGLAARPGAARWAALWAALCCWAVPDYGYHSLTQSCNVMRAASHSAWPALLDAFWLQPIESHTRHPATSPPYLSRSLLLIVDPQRLKLAQAEETLIAAPGCACGCGFAPAAKHRFQDTARHHTFCKRTLCCGPRPGAVQHATSRVCATAVHRRR